MNETAFERPRSVEEAAELLARPGSIVLAGGTALMFLVKHYLVNPARLVWIGRVAEMAGIEAGDGVTTIGAGVTLADLAGSAVIRGRHPMLSSAAAAVGNPRVRSVATIGGAVVHADPRQDLLPALLAADASVRIVGRRGARWVRLRDGFFRGFMSVDLEDEELVTTVTLPHRPASIQRYVRFAPDSKDDYPTVAVAAAIELDDGGEVEDVALALAGVAETPLFVDGVADVLTSAPTSATVELVSEHAMEAASPLDDGQGSSRYKRAMTRVWVERVLHDLLGIEETGGPPGPPG